VLGERAFAQIPRSEPERPPTESEKIRVVARPESPFIERRGRQQLVEFDLLLQNHGTDAYQLAAIKAQVFDRNNKLEAVRELNGNGHPPALDSVGERVLMPGGAIDIFQPFFSFDATVDLSLLHLELLFVKAGRNVPPIVIRADQTVAIDVRPKAYTPASFCLPLRGLVLVHDGHDFNSHHRRFNLMQRSDRDPAMAVNANLYAYDFVRTNSSGSLFHGAPDHKENWLSYEEPIYSPSDGMVVDAVTDIPDNSFGSAGEVHTPPGAEAKDPLGMGNHVTIDHPDGRTSWLLHMEQGSVQVKVGDRVSAGQLLGRIGFSGDSLFPHLHYNVTASHAYPSQGVPSYFHDFIRGLGSHQVRLPYGQVDSGDLVSNSARDGACR
jgi:hypothetical protein